jgi:hypothetical protein
MLRREAVRHDPPNPLHVLALALATFLLYWLTLAPTFSWGDSADLPLRVFGEPQSEAEATARDYVLYRQVGRAFLQLPFGDVAYRVNLLSATASAGAVVAVFLMVRRRTGRNAAGAAAALALACSHTWWWMSVVSEVYTFAGCLMLISLWLWLNWTEEGGRRRLIAAGAASGLAASAHGAGALLLLPVLWHAFRCRDRAPARDWLAGGVAMLAGSGFLIVMVVQAFSRGGLAGLAEALDASNPTVSVWGTAIKGGVLMLYQYPGLATVFGAVGVVQLWPGRHQWDRLALGAWVVLVIYAPFSRFPDAFNAYCLSYAIFAPIVGIGGAAVLARLEARGVSARAAAGASVAAVAALPMIVYSAVPAAAGYLAIDLTGARICPERNNNWYFMYPPKHYDRGPRRFTEGAFDAAGRDGVIVADYTLWRPLKYLQVVEGRRPDLHLQIVDPYLAGDALVQFVSAQLRTRPVYLAAVEPPAYYDLDRLKQAFTITPVGPVFELRAR